MQVQYTIIIDIRVSNIYAIILAAQSMYNYGTWSRPQTRPHHLGPSAARASGENAIDDII